MTIRKVCKTLKQAERYQQRLYSRYEVVQLVASPAFGEAGTYVWHVGNKSR